MERQLPEAEFLHVPGGGHAPTEDGDGEGRILPGYEAGLVDWIGRFGGQSTTRTS